MPYYSVDGFRRGRGSHHSVENGAVGYLLKNIDADFFLDAIRRAMQGDSVISNEMTAKLVANLRRGHEPIPSEISKLTPREGDILSQLASGLSNKEIARELNLAESTVKIHIQSILKKLGLSNRVQAAIYAVERGLGIQH